VLFMLHSDSRRLGKKVLEPALQAAECTARLDCRSGDLWTLSADSPAGRSYLRALTAATHAALANRAALVQLLRQVLRKVLGDGGLECPLVFDCGHETIQAEIHRGERLWVHRHGASRALPADRLREDPVLGRIGQPVPVPGSMGSDSYVAVVRPGAADAYCSVAHGAGRVMEKTRACEEYAAAEVEDLVRRRGVRLYRYGVDDIAGQMPHSFKDPALVVEAMREFGLIAPVARSRPVAVLKG
jgi:tRNA-splicing ligase RtcB